MPDSINWLLTVAGMGVTLIALGPRCSEQRRQFLVFLGAVIMLAVAVNDRAWFFVALQVVVVSGGAAGMAQLSPAARAAPPLTAAAIVMPQLLSEGAHIDLNSAATASGLIMLALGYALRRPALYAAAGFLVALASYLQWLAGYDKAIAWAIFNLVFFIMALRQVVAPYAARLRQR